MSKQPIQPDQQDYLEQDIAGDAPGATWVPPDEPLGAQSHGITAAEQRRGETFDYRMKHTEPEVFDLGIHESEEEVGRLVQPGDEDIDLEDYESNTVAIDSGEDDGDLSAEEAAMHTTEAP